MSFLFYVFADQPQTPSGSDVRSCVIDSQLLWFGQKVAGNKTSFSVSKTYMSEFAAKFAPEERSMRTDPDTKGKDMVEKFSELELSTLRTELTQSGIDSWQAAEVLSLFLAGRGYGINPELARTAVSRMELNRCGHDCLQAELEKVAWVM